MASREKGGVFQTRKCAPLRTPLNRSGCKAVSSAGKESCSPSPDSDEPSRSIQSAQLGREEFSGSAHIVTREGRGSTPSTSLMVNQ
jgi:hypothetical protein